MSRRIWHTSLALLFYMLVDAADASGLSQSPVIKAADTAHQVLNEVQLIAARRSVLRNFRESSERRHCLASLPPTSGSMYVIAFPEGESQRFFFQEGNLVGFYQSSKNDVKLLWEAETKPASSLNGSRNSSYNGFFIFRKVLIKRQCGALPSLSSNFVYYDVSVPPGYVSYGKIYSNGKVGKVVSKSFDHDEYNSVISPVKDESLNNKR